MPDYQYVRSCQLPTLPDFRMGEQPPPIDNQLLTKTFCSRSGDRLSVRNAGKRKDCGLCENHILRILVIKSLTLEHQVFETC